MGKKTTPVQYDVFLTSIRRTNAKTIGVSIEEMDEMGIHKIEEKLKIK